MKEHRSMQTNDHIIDPLVWLVNKDKQTFVLFSFYFLPCDQPELVKPLVKQLGFTKTILANGRDEILNINILVESPSSAMAVSPLGIWKLYLHLPFGHALSKAY